MERQLHVLLLVVSLLVTARPAAGQGIITTVAGSTSAFSGSGGPAVNATLGMLSGVAVDSAGNVYAYDSDNNLVVRIAPAGVLTIVAGNGTSGFSGDGGPATNAALGTARVSGLAVDAAGNLFIADTANNRIRKVAPNGIISTVAGNGAPDFSGDGGPATRAALDHPNGVALDASGNLFIADGGNCRIRKVTPDGTISTLAGLTAGASSVGQDYPTGIAVDSAGNVFAAFSITGFVRKATPDGLISTVAGNGTFGSSGDGGPATAAAILPTGVAVDPAGNVFIGEDHRIRKIGREGVISTVAGDGTAGFSGDGGDAIAARFNFTCGLAADSAGNLLIADGGNGRIRKITPAGAISTVAGNGLYYFGGDGGPATAARLDLSTPSMPPVGGVAVDSLGNVFIADTVNHRVRKVDTYGVIRTVVGNGLPGSSGDGGPATGATLIYPLGLAFDSAGNLFVADSSHVRKVARDGTISTVAGDGIGTMPGSPSGDGGPATRAHLHSPRGVAVDAAGNLFIAETGMSRVRKVAPGGIISTVAGGVWAEAVAVDSAGNLWIAGGNFVGKVSLDGIISTIAGGGRACPGDGGPATRAALTAYGIAVDAASNIFIADGANHRVLKTTTAGAIWTVAGNGSPVFSGDGGPATRAGLSAGAVALDSAGSLFISDTLNNRVRKVLNPAQSAAVPCVTPTPLLYGGRPADAASSSTNVAAGSMAWLSGSDLAPAFTDGLATQLPLPTSLNDVMVWMNGIAAPLFSVSPARINLQVPWELTGQNPIALTVSVKGISSAGWYFALKQAAPGVFFVSSRALTLGSVQIANSTLYAWPVDGVPGVPSRPAKRGEYVTIYCSGLGDVTNRPPSGAAASSNPLSVTLAAPTVMIGGRPALVTFSGLAPGFVGLYQINAQVPADAPVGERVPLSVTQAGAQSNTVVIAVQ